MPQFSSPSLHTDPIKLHSRLSSSHPHAPPPCIQNVSHRCLSLIGLSGAGERFHYRQASSKRLLGSRDWAFLSTKAISILPRSTQKFLAVHLTTDLVFHLKWSRLSAWGFHLAWAVFYSQKVNAPGSVFSHHRVDDSESQWIRTPTSFPSVEQFGSVFYHLWKGSALWEASSQGVAPHFLGTLKE